MSKFTKGKWEYSDDTNVKIPVRNWFRVFNRKKKIGIALVPEEANARLIAAAPEMYELLREELIPTSDYGGIISFEREKKIKTLLAQIDGEEMKA